MRVRLLYVGKPRSRPLNEAAGEYAKRLGRYCRFEMEELKRPPRSGERDKAMRIVLDPRGATLSSAELARVVETAGRDLCFYVGGSEGFSDEFRDSADLLLSLSALTLPHELARVVVAEQIYRAFTLLRGHPYPR